MTDGDATPAAERAAPKRAPEVVVARRFAIFTVLMVSWKFNGQSREILGFIRG